MAEQTTKVEAPAPEVPVVVTATVARPRWYAVVDLAERAGWTFVQSFAAALTLGTLTDLAALKLAGIAGGYAVLKYLGTRANAYLDGKR